MLSSDHSRVEILLLHIFNYFPQVDFFLELFQIREYFLISMQLRELWEYVQVFSNRKWDLISPRAYSNITSARIYLNLKLDGPWIPSNLLRWMPDFELWSWQWRLAWRKNRSLRWRMPAPWSNQKRGWVYIVQYTTSRKPSTAEISAILKLAYVVKESME